MKHSPSSIENILISNPSRWRDASKQLFIFSAFSFVLAFSLVFLGWDFSQVAPVHHILDSSAGFAESPEKHYKDRSQLHLEEDYSPVFSSFTVAQQQHRVRWAFSFLWAIIVTLSFPLGAMFFVLMQHLSRAGWSVVVRRVAEQVMRTIPWVFCLLWGWMLLGGIQSVFHWVHPDDPILLKKVPYLNVTFFLIRMVSYFLAWIFLSHFFIKHSFAQDRNANAQHTISMQRFSGPWTFVYTASITFFAFDAIMSIDPHWYSTILGIYYFSGSMVAFLSLLALILIALLQFGYLKNIVTIEHLHDIAKLLFGFNAFWAYTAFSQYGIIWYGNIPEETLWYLERFDDPFWLAISRIVVVGHLVFPLVTFISKHTKRNISFSVFIYILLITMHVLDMYFLVMPRCMHFSGANHGVVHQFFPQLIDVLFLLACTSFFAAFVVRFLADRPLIPLADPRLQESLDFHNP